MLVSLCYCAALRRRLGLGLPCVGCGVCPYRARGGRGCEQPLNEALGATLCFYCGDRSVNLPLGNSLVELSFPSANLVPSLPEVLYFTQVSRSVRVMECLQPIYILGSLLAVVR